MRRATPLSTLCLLAAPALSQNHFATQPKADDVFYHIMPITWRDGPDSDASDPNRYGDLVGMREGLPYLDDLGITAIWMNPIFPSPAYHGYQHGAADSINPWFGTESDFADFNVAAHALGIEVYIDFVVYGISHNSPWFSSAFANPGSPFDSWLAFYNGSNTDYQGYTFNTWNGDSVGFIHWDLRTPAATSLVSDWAVKWLDPNTDGDFSDGVDGYRLDHVWVNYGNGPDGWGYNLSTFWDTWHNAIRSANPGVFTFAEQHNWGSHGAEYLPQFDAAMTKPFEFAARDALFNENADPLYGQMRATIDSLPSGQGTYVAIIGDHDVDRLASAIGATSAGALGRAEAAAAVLLLQPFPPVIYSGDEIAMLGTKQDYGSDANDIPMREPFKWNAVEGAPMSRYHQENFFATSNQFSSNNDGRSVQEQSSSGVLQSYKDLIARRHANVALRRGDYHEIDATSGSVWAFLRHYEQGDAPIADPTQAIAVAINLSSLPVTTQLDLSPYHEDGESLAATNLAPGGGVLPNITDANAAGYSVTIPAHSYALIQADLTRPAPPEFDLDGQLDSAYVEVATSAGGSIWAGLDGDTLYIATQPASDGRDRFLVLAESPGSQVPAMWAKAGLVPAYDAFMGNEVDNGWSGWFDAATPGGPVVGPVLEGSIDLVDQFGSVPESVHLAALSYLTGDGEPLDPSLQVPSGNGDLDVTPDEFVEVILSELEGCPADLAEPLGVLDFSDVVAFLSAFGSMEALADLAAPFGVWDFSDVVAFLASFGAGCP